MVEECCPECGGSPAQLSKPHECITNVGRVISPAAKPGPASECPSARVDPKTFVPNHSSFVPLACPNKWGTERNRADDRSLSERPIPAAHLEFRMISLLSERHTRSSNPT
jgi:hypothetical protein